MRQSAHPCRLVLPHGTASIQQVRYSPNCLVLCFEDLVANLPAHIAVLSRFMGGAAADDEAELVRKVLPTSCV